MIPCYATLKEKLDIEVSSCELDHPNLLNIRVIKVEKSYRTNW